MASLRVKIEWEKSERKWLGIPKIDRRILWGALIISLLIHFVTWLSSGWMDNIKQPIARDSIKIRNVTKDEKKLLDKMQQDVANAKRIVETPLKETEAPKLPSSLGAQDHSTDHESKLAKKYLNDSKALDPGIKPPTPSLAKPTASTPIATAHAKPKPEKISPQIFTGPGSMAIGTHKEKPRTVYESLLPNKANDVFEEPNKGGYMEHIDGDIAEGDHIDMNTTSFKYISYFTGMRKQIELVWIYPNEAVQRGLQGAVQLEMTIEKDGKVSKIRIVESSGYVLLDDNMLKTIKMASPFAPLPKGWAKDRIVVTGSFHYVLTYAGH